MAKTLECDPPNEVETVLPLTSLMSVELYSPLVRGYITLASPSSMYFSRPGDGRSVDLSLYVLPGYIP